MKQDEKKRRRDALQAVKQQEQSQFLSSLPAPETEIKALFDHLDEKLEDCDDTLRETISFIKKKDISETKMVEWLKEHGGHCDCEVIANVEDKWNQMTDKK